MKNEYKEPEEIIDHNGNLDTVTGLMSIFFAYNQKETDEGATWSNWPDWELCLTSMKDSLHFEDDSDSDEIKVERAHWLGLFQLIHENDAISFDGYTITIEGQHGHTSHLMYPLNNCWMNTGAMAEYDRRYEEWKQNKRWMVMRSVFTTEMSLHIPLAHSGHVLSTCQSMAECRRLRHSMIGIASTRLSSK